MAPPGERNRPAGNRAAVRLATTTASIVADSLDIELHLPSVSGRLVVDLSANIDRDWHDLVGHASIPAVPAGVAVELHITHARFVEPYMGDRIAEELRSARSITVVGENPAAIAELVSQLRRALAGERPAVAI